MGGPEERGHDASALTMSGATGNGSRNKNTDGHGGRTVAKKNDRGTGK